MDIFNFKHKKSGLPNKSDKPLLVECIVEYTYTTPKPAGRAGE
jgi:hypothetical protein